MKILEVLRRALAGEEIPEDARPLRLPPPVGELLGFRLVAIDDGESVVVLDAEPRHANPMGTLHGGILCDIADAAMGLAQASTLEVGESFTTLELKINYLRPFWTGRIEARGRVAHRGRTVSYVECDVIGPDGRLVARASSTVLTLRGEQARGR